MIDVGGTNIKLRCSGEEEERKFPSGCEMSAEQMAAQAKELARDWKYERVSIGFPGLVANNKPIREPLNLGCGWGGFDYEAAFGKPVRIIHDTSLQALAAYEGGRLLFLTFGTSIGCAIIVDGRVIPIEVGLLRLSKKHTFLDRLSDEGLERDGEEAWIEHAKEAIGILQDVFWPTDTVLSGGNAKRFKDLPPKCRRRSNKDALLGAERLWPGADLHAEPRGSSWEIV